MIEEHITFDTSPCVKNTKDWISGYVKIIDIELSNNEHQIMTSDIVSIYDVIKKETKALKFFHNRMKRVKITRIKYETSPEWFLKNREKYKLKNLYNESHLRVMLTKHNSDVINRVCKKYDLHRSRNVFKKINGDYSLLMLTLRRNDLSIENFETLVSRIKADLVRGNISYDKVEVEVCISDSNIDLDSNWIKNEHRKP